MEIKTYAFLDNEKCPTCNESLAIDITLTGADEGGLLLSSKSIKFCLDCTPIGEQPETTDRDVEWDELVEEDVLRHRAEQVCDTVASVIASRLMGRVIYHVAQRHRNKANLSEVASGNIHG